MSRKNDNEKIVKDPKKTTTSKTATRKPKVTDETKKETVKKPRPKKPPIKKIKPSITETEKPEIIEVIPDNFVSQEQEDIDITIKQDIIDTEALKTEEVEIETKESSKVDESEIILEETKDEASTLKAEDDTSTETDKEEIIEPSKEVIEKESWFNKVKSNFSAYVAKLKEKEVKSEVDEEEFKKPLIERVDGGEGFQPNQATSLKPVNHRGLISTGFSKIVTIFVVLCLFVTIIGGGVAIIYVSNKLSTTPILDIKKLKPASSSIVYDSKGNVIGELGKEIRQNVTYEQIPQCLIDAFVSIEDSRFFVHNGFDVPRFIKAAINNIKTRDFSQGGSTLTMQLVKNSYFVEKGSGGAEKSIERKIQEIYLSLIVDKSVDKKTIFENYVNKNNYGGPYRGLEKAANYYFDKSVEEISLSEAALLAGVINLPNYYNPFLNLKEGTKRRNEVLDLMYNHGYITELDLKMAKAIKLEDLLVKEKVYQKLVPYQAYIDTVIDEIIRVTGEDPYVVPMKIYTAMNTEAQTAIEDIQANKYRDRGINVQKQKGLDTATVAIENSTGEVVAIGGGRNYNGQRLFNFATQMKKQPGSSIKPVLEYALAFEHLGFTTGMYVNDFPIYYPGSRVKVNNWSRSYMGQISLQIAISYSQNVPAIVTLRQVESAIGIDKIIKYMNDIGFKWVNKNNYSTQLGIGGASFQTSPLEMASAYQMLFNYGLWIEPHTVRKIEYFESDSKPNYVANPKKTQALSPQAAWLAASMLKAHVDRNLTSSTYLLKKKYPVYGKTGTSDWGTSGRKYGLYGSKDTWMAACTTRHSMVTWVGFDTQARGHNYTTTGYYLHGRINRKMLDVLNVGQKTNPTLYARPSGIVSVSVAKGFYPFVRPSAEYPGTTGLAKKGGTKFVDPPPIPAIPNIASVSITSPAFDTYKIEMTPGPALAEVVPNPDQFGIYWIKQNPNNPASFWGNYLYYGTITYNGGSKEFVSATPVTTITLNESTQGPIQVCAVYGFAKSPKRSPEVTCFSIDANPKPVTP